MKYKSVEIVTPTNYEETYLKKEFSRAPRHYQEMKKRYEGFFNLVFLFRQGDFWGTYCEDAEVCASVLGITLNTMSRNYRLAGFPHHALDTYLPKLIRAGYRVAICDL